jgi:hypothetical protein
VYFCVYCVRKKKGVRNGVRIEVLVDQYVI